MSKIGFEDGSVVVDAELVAEGLGLEPGRVVEMMRDGSITGLCERGVGTDAGRWRLSFFHAGRSFWVVIDDAGHVIQKRGAPPQPPSGPDAAQG